MKNNKHPVDINVGVRIRKIRKESRVSQEQLAHSLGISHQQLQKYEAATNRVSASKLFTIADYFKVPIDYFFKEINSSNAEDQGIRCKECQFLFEKSLRR